MMPGESTGWECHGTGTSLGDPIEVGSVRKVQIADKREEPLLIATMKTNTGHMEGGAAMSSIVRAIVQVSRSRCMPVLHLGCLNPHLDHGADFECRFVNEVTAYPYNQGHSQVSSFGFGGTNGHMIFWGSRIYGTQVSPSKKFLAKMKSSLPPRVVARGKNPADWESDWPDPHCKVGTQYKIKFTKGEDEPLKWEQVEKEDEIVPEQPEYAITGNFNDWSDDRMKHGDIEGLFMSVVEIPSSGTIEFRFLQDGDSEKVIAPRQDNCSSMSASLTGPAPDLTTKFAVKGDAGSWLQVELFMTKEFSSVMWMKSFSASA